MVASFGLVALTVICTSLGFSSDLVSFCKDRFGVLHISSVIIIAIFTYILNRLFFGEYLILTDI